MVCEKCGTEIEEGMTNCPQCGYEIISEKEYEEQETAKIEKKKEAKKSFVNEITVWSVFSVLSFLGSGFTLYKGIDKMIHYNSGDFYPYDLVNAYVGGDAYNYIINGTYATAFFVLTAMLFLGGIGFVAVHYLSKKK